MWLAACGDGCDWFGVAVCGLVWRFAVWCGLEWYDAREKLVLGVNWFDLVCVNRQRKGGRVRAEKNNVGCRVAEWPIYGSLKLTLPALPCPS